MTAGEANRLSGFSGEVPPVGVQGHKQAPPGFPTGKLLVFGIIQVVTGIWAIVIGVVAIATQAWGYNYGAGFWSGLMFMISGSVCLNAARSKSNCSVLASLVLSIIASIIALVVLALSAIGMSTNGMLLRDSNPGRDELSSYSVNIIVVVVATVAAMCSVIAAILGCKAINNTWSEQDECVEDAKPRKPHPLRLVMPKQKKFNPPPTPNNPYLHVEKWLRDQQAHEYTYSPPQTPIVEMSSCAIEESEDNDLKEGESGDQSPEQSSQVTSALLGVKRSETDVSLSKKSSPQRTFDLDTAYGEGSNDFDSQELLAVRQNVGAVQSGFHSKSSLTMDQEPSNQDASVTASDQNQVNESQDKRKDSIVTKSAFKPVSSSSPVEEVSVPLLEKGTTQEELPSQDTRRKTSPVHFTFEPVNTQQEDSSILRPKPVYSKGIEQPKSTAKKSSKKPIFRRTRKRSIEESPIPLKPIASVPGNSRSVQLGFLDAIQKSLSTKSSVSELDRTSQGSGPRSRRTSTTRSANASNDRLRPVYDTPSKRQESHALLQDNVIEEKPAEHRSIPPVPHAVAAAVTTRRDYRLPEVKPDRPHQEVPRTQPLESPAEGGSSNQIERANTDPSYRVQESEEAAESTPPTEARQSPSEPPGTPPPMYKTQQTPAKEQSVRPKEYKRAQSQKSFCIVDDLDDEHAPFRASLECIPMDASPPQEITSEPPLQTNKPASNAPVAVIPPMRFEPPMPVYNNQQAPRNTSVPPPHQHSRTPHREDPGSGRGRSRHPQQSSRPQQPSGQSRPSHSSGQPRQQRTSSSNRPSQPPKRNPSQREKRSSSEPKESKGDRQRMFSYTTSPMGQHLNPATVARKYHDIANRNSKQHDSIIKVLALQRLKVKAAKNARARRSSSGHSRRSDGESSQTRPPSGKKPQRSSSARRPGDERVSSNLARTHSSRERDRPSVSHITGRPSRSSAPRTSGSSYQQPSDYDTSPLPLGNVDPNSVNQLPPYMVQEMEKYASEKASTVTTFGAYGSIRTTKSSEAPTSESHAPQDNLRSDPSDNPEVQDYRGQMSSSRDTSNTDQGQGNQLYTSIL